MLKDTTLTKLATLAKIDMPALKAAIVAADEQEIVIDENIQALTKTELESRDRNKYNEGKTAGTEMVIKDIKAKHNLEVEGVDPDKVVEAIGKKAVTDAGIAPDAAVTEQKKLTQQWKDKAAAAEQTIASVKAEKEQLAHDNKIRALLPKNRADILTDDEFLMSVNGRFKIETRENKEVVIDRATNEIIQDKTSLEPVTPGKVIENYFGERKWVTDPNAGGGSGGAGGRGGGNSNPGGGMKGKFGKLSEVRAHLDTEGINPQGEKGQAFIQAAIKENPTLDLKS